MVLMLMVQRVIAQQGRMTGELLVRSDGRGASTRLDVAPTVVVLLCLLSLRALPRCVLLFSVLKPMVSMRSWRLRLACDDG